MKHGSRSTYVNKKCRCEPCSDAQREYQKSRVITKHNKNGYKTGCRCDLCKEDHAKYRIEYVKSRPVAHGTISGYTLDSCRCADCSKALREYQQLTRYGLSPEDFNALLVAQRGLCAGCNLAFSETPHIDHDHATGLVRGLLCRGCNLALGLVKDEVDTLRRLASYLEN